MIGDDHPIGGRPLDDDGPGQGVGDGPQEAFEGPGSALAAAREDLDRLQREADEEGLDPPAPATVVEARRILDALEPTGLSGLALSVSLGDRADVVIQAKGRSGSVAIVLEKSGAAASFTYADGASTRRRYGSSSEVPDALICESLAKIALAPHVGR